MEKQLHILLADDDEDDRFFFEKALEESGIPAQLKTVGDGEKLMSILSENIEQLPDVLFLDLNMPRKSGMECLTEIKLNEKLKHVPVIICSTCLHNDVADILYNKGAHYFIRKTEITELQKVLHYIVTLMMENNFILPARDKFILTLATEVISV